MLELNSETHTYSVNGSIVPGVTEILSAQGMIDLWGIPVFQLQRARDLGKAVHSTCEYFDKGILKISTLDEGIVPYLKAWIKFLKENEVEILATEQIF